MPYRTSMLALPALALAACNAATLTQDDRPAIGDEYLIASAANHEQCRVRKLSDDQTRLRVEAFDIRCDGWDVPAATIKRFKFAESSPLEPLLLREDLIPWQATKLDCGELVETELAGGQAAIVRNCTSREGWPMQAWAVRTAAGNENAAIAGFGYPHIAPVIEHMASGAIDGETVVSRGGTRSPLLALAQNSAGGRLPDLADIMDFDLLLTVAARYNQAGEFSNAVEAIEQALIRQKSVQGADTPHLATVYAELGLNLASDGRVEAAEASFEEAARRAERIPWSDAYTLYLSYLAIHRRLKGELVEATELTEAVVERRLTQHGPGSMALAHARGIEASLRLETGEIERARELAETALRGHRRIRDYAGMSFALGRLAQIERAAGDSAAASEALGEAIALTERLYGDGPNMAYLLAERGQIALANDNPEEAIADFASMVSSLEAGLDNAARGPAGDMETYLQLLIAHASGRQDRLAEAFKVAQWLGNPVVDKAVRQMMARLASDDPEIAAAVEELEQARENVRVQRFALAQGELDSERSGTLIRSNDAFDEANAALAAERARVRALEADLQARFPRFGRLRAPGRVSAVTASASLRADEGLLRLIVGEEANYAILLTSDGTLHTHIGPLNRELATTGVRHLRTALTFANGLQPFDMNAAHAFYTALVGNLDAEIGRLRHVAVVADGPLLSLPLALLPRRPSNAGMYHRAAWLGRDTAISMASSVASFVGGRRDLSPSRATRAFFGLGDPALAGGGRVEDAVRTAVADCERGGTFDPLILKALPSLPETRDELFMVAAALGDEAPLIKAGYEARETSLSELDLSDFRVLSFATHGLLPHELPCNAKPALVMTPPDASGTADDGLLDVAEIAALRLDAELVVLSACNTAGPDGSLGGEALTGLASAFIHAGSRSLIASHWDVASAATVTLMQETFAAYGRSGDKALALQAAQRRLMADPDLAHPAFWAAFTLIGDRGAEDMTLAMR